MLLPDHFRDATKMISIAHAGVAELFLALLGHAMGADSGRDTEAGSAPAAASRNEYRSRKALRISRNIFLSDEVMESDSNTEYFA